MIAADGDFGERTEFYVPDLIGILKPWSGEDAPDGWFPADGRTTNARFFRALESVLNYRFGGDPRREEYALPDLRGTPPREGRQWVLCYKGDFPGRPDR